MSSQTNPLALKSISNAALSKLQFPYHFNSISITKHCLNKTTPARPLTEPETWSQEHRALIKNKSTLIHISSDPSGFHTVNPEFAISYAMTGFYSLLREAPTFAAKFYALFHNQYTDSMRKNAVWLEREREPSHPVLKSSRQEQDPKWGRNSSKEVWEGTPSVNNIHPLFTSESLDTNIDTPPFYRCVCARDTCEALSCPVYHKYCEMFMLPRLFSSFLR